KQEPAPAPITATSAPSNAPPLLSLPSQQQQSQPPQTQPQTQPQPSQGPRQILYNGIALNQPWPPRYPPPGPEPMAVPYLRESPAVVPIDVGRQFFIDDFLVESSTNIKRTFHLAEYYTNNPVLIPDKPWESEGGKSSAMANAGGVWYDQQDKLFKVWYTAGDSRSICFAYSTNGTN